MYDYYQKRMGLPLVEVKVGGYLLRQVKGFADVIQRAIGRNTTPK